MPEEKYQQESISAGEGSNLRKQVRSQTIQDKSGKCLTEKQEILSRWTDYFPDLHNYESCGDNAVLDCSRPPENLQPILREELKIAVASLQKGKPPGVDNTRITCSIWRGDHDRCVHTDLLQDLENNGMACR